MTFQPTPEQSDCIEKFATGKRLRVNAYAGTGKTSTLTLLAKSTKRRGTYVAFNKSIAEEARHKFPQNINCSTMHALAFRAIKERGYRVEDMTGNVNGGFLAARCNYRKYDVGPDLSISARGWGSIVIETLRRWQRSGDDTMTERHAVLEGKLDMLNATIAAHLRRKIVEDAWSLWDRMTRRNPDLPMGHDGYLKLFALGRPKIDGDFILLDEAQDTNGVVMELMRHQSAQLITVGDRHQSIYEWRGALNAMVELPCDLEARLSTSFRFGPNVAGYATEILKLLDETLPLKGNPARNDSLGPIAKPRTILARTNGALIEELVHQLTMGVKPHIVGGVTEMLTMIDATEKLEANQTVENPLMFFGFRCWAEVVAASTQEDCSADLRRWVNLVEKYGTNELRRAFQGLPAKEEGAPLVLATGHKSKGREWDEVRLMDDFLMGVSTKDKPEQTIDGKAPKWPAPELRLFYVAATRAKDKLEVHDALTDRLEALKRRKADEANDEAEAASTQGPGEEPTKRRRRHAA